MKTLRDRPSIYIALIMMLLLSGAVGVIGVDLAQGHHAALQDRENVPLAKEEYSLLRTVTSRMLPEYFDVIDDEPSLLRPFPVAAIPLFLFGVALTVSFFTRQCRLNISGFFARCHLQFRFIHSREAFSSIT